MPRGGKRENAGRKPGSTTQKTREIADKAAKEGILPLDVMLNNMRFYYERAEVAFNKLLDGVLPAEVIAAEGQGKIADDDKPLTVIDVLKLVLSLRERAEVAAKDAAPYLHPRINSIEAGGGGGEEHVPLAERLAAYEREDAIAGSAGKVVEMPKKKARK